METPTHLKKLNSPPPTTEKSPTLSTKSESSPVSPVLTSSATRRLSMRKPLPPSVWLLNLLKAAISAHILQVFAKENKWFRNRIFGDLLFRWFTHSRHCTKLTSSIEILNLRIYSWPRITSKSKSVIWMSPFWAKVEWPLHKLELHTTPAHKYGRTWHIMENAIYGH